MAQADVLRFVERCQLERRSSTCATVVGLSQKALVVLEKFAVPMAAWRVHATAREYYRRMKNDETAEKHRTRAEELIRLLANSFDEGEPLRESLLAADPGSGGVKMVVP